MISRRRQLRQAGPALKRVAPVLAAVALVAAVATVPPTVAATTTQGPPGALFRWGYNLCHAAPLAAIRKAGRQIYKPGTFSHHVCTWERTDLRAGIALSTHPPAVGNALMRMFKAQSGEQHITARPVKIKQATKALLVTFPTAETTQHSKYLFAAYSRGVIQVNMTAPNSLPTRRLEAVLRLISRTGAPRR